MNLFKLERRRRGLPVKAGTATLKWFKPREVEKLPRPWRSDDSIFLPYHEDVDFHILLNGQQFVWEDHRYSQVFFGGTDESPFLVQLHPCYSMSELGNQRTFFSSLKPDGIRSLEKHFRTKALRQGDWYALPIPIPFNLLIGTLHLFGAWRSSSILLVEKPDKSVRLNGTRHLLKTKRYIPLDALVSHFPGLYLITDGGIMVSADHSNLKLRGTHVLSQTTSVIYQKSAD